MPSVIRLTYQLWLLAWRIAKRKGDADILQDIELELEQLEEVYNVGRR